MHRLELVAASDDVDRAREVARGLSGRLLVDPRDDVEGLPFRALISAVTDDLEALLEAGDVGAWVACRRVLKAEPASAGAADGRASDHRGVIALFTMARRPDLTHLQADRHWRDRHVPLALHHHPFMTYYVQLSLLHRLRGPEWDGFALCGFDSLDDLRLRFYGSPEGKTVIRQDVARFADPGRSPRRLIVTEESFG